MSDIQLYLLEYDRNKKDASAIAQKSADKLQKKELKLLALIESLGEYVNHEDPAFRGKTMAYLAEVLAALPPKTLTTQQRNLLFDFILSRIVDDTEGVGHCAKGLMALEERGQWDHDKASSVITSLVDQTHPLRQYKAQSERYSVVQLIDLLMAKYRDAMSDVHKTVPNFLEKFISYFDGEKDPRNLMVVFSILKVPMTEWDAGKNTQDLFDSVFNYFPITFRPPPDDPYGITAQDLKDRLRECIASTSAFAPYAFPALLDKLDSTSMNTKRDSLDAIRSCVEEYGTETVLLYAVTLWDALKFEILNVQEEDLAERALDGLAAIAKQLSKGTSGQLHAYLHPITKECNEHLEDAPTKQSQATGRILEKLVAASPQAANFLVLNIVPNILTLHHTADNVAKRRGLFEVFVKIIRATIQVYGEWRLSGPNQYSGAEKNNIGQLPENALSKFSDQALHLMLNELSTASVKEVSYRLTLVDGLLQLAKVRQLLDDEDISKIIQVLYDVLITEESYGKDEIKEAAINALVEIAHQKPQLVIDKAFPSFMAEIPDVDVKESKAYLSALEAFAKLSAEGKVFQTVVLRLKNKINSAIHQGASSAYLAALLSAMLYAFSKGAFATCGSPAGSYYEDIARPFLAHTANPEVLQSKPFEDDIVLDLIGRICNVIIRALPASEHQTIAMNIYSIFQNQAANTLPPFVEGTSQQQRLMLINTHLVAALRKDAPLPFDAGDLLRALVDFAKHESLSARVRAGTLKQISLVVNKFVPNAELKALLEPILHAPMDLMSAANLNATNIRIVFAILKGLVLRNSPMLSAVFPSLLDTLSDEKYGTLAARGFSTLLQPDDLLTKDNFCTISGLHRQKTFTLLVPAIASSVKTASPATKTNYLIALSGILRWLSYEVLAPEVESLSPLLLQSLDLPGEDEVKSSTIEVINLVLNNSPRTIEEHTGSLINRLLNTTDPKTNPSKVRAEALKCLTLLPGVLRIEVILPFRRQVVKKLTAALDDGKRLVRAEAVRCRAKWLELDEAGDDDD